MTRSSFPAWSDFATATPTLAESIQALFQQYGPGMGYLATVRADGAPRIHPVAPIITDDGLYCFIVASPKRRDLERDGRYALHAFPAEYSDAEACVTGRARPVIDPMVVEHVARRHRAANTVDWLLFEFSVQTAMLNRHAPGASPITWQAGPSSTARPLPRRIPRLHFELLAA